MLEKLAITATSERLVCNLCALSHGYHTLKANYRDAFLHASAAQIAQTSIDVLKSAVVRVRAMLPFPRVSPDVLPVPPELPAASRAEQSFGCDPRAGVPRGEPEVAMRPPSNVFLLEEAGREFCEPECSGLLAGMHHGCCSQSTLLREAENQSKAEENMVLPLAQEGLAETRRQEMNVISTSFN